MLGPSCRLFGLAGGGVYPAGAVTDTAVRSYRTISPLPPALTFDWQGRFQLKPLSEQVALLAVF